MMADKNVSTLLDGADFQTVAFEIMKAQDNIRQQDTLPTAANTTSVANVWTDFTATIINRWQSTTTISGGVRTLTLRDNKSVTPGWAISDAAVVAKYLKIGRLMRIKLAITMGNTPFYTSGVGSSLVNDGSSTFPDYAGENGATSLVLPFPPRPSAHGGYALGYMATTSSYADSAGGGKTYRKPMFYNGSTTIIGSDVSVDPSLLQTGVYTRLDMPLLDNWHKDTVTYYSGQPGYQYPQPGERFILCLKYDTDQ